MYWFEMGRRGKRDVKQEGTGEVMKIEKNLVTGRRGEKEKTDGDKREELEKARGFMIKKKEKEKKEWREAL